MARKRLSAKILESTSVMANQFIIGGEADNLSAGSAMFACGIGTSVLGASEAGSGFVVPIACTISMLYIWADGGIGSGESTTVTLYKNGIATALQAVALSTTGNAGNNTVDTITCLAGDRIKFAIVQSAGATNLNIGFGAVGTI